MYVDWQILCSSETTTMDFEALKLLNIRLGNVYGSQFSMTFIMIIRSDSEIVDPAIVVTWIQKNITFW